VTCWSIFRSNDQLIKPSTNLYNALVKNRNNRQLKHNRYIMKISKYDMKIYHHLHIIYQITLYLMHIHFCVNSGGSKSNFILIHDQNAKCPFQWPPDIHAAEQIYITMIICTCPVTVARSRLIRADSCDATKKWFNNKSAARAPPLLIHSYNCFCFLCTSELWAKKKSGMP
jgi:hypothetical protein